MLALGVALLCVQAKLGLVPFDMAEAETEIVSGPLIEYSGDGARTLQADEEHAPLCAAFFLMIALLGRPPVERHARLCTGFSNSWGLVAVVTVIRNTNPRVRIDQAVRFFWGRVTVAAAVAVVLAFLGK